MASQALATDGTPALSLKSKGGKPFSVFGRLTDESSLHRAWRVSNKVAAFLEQGHRIENMAWRLWHVRDVMATQPLGGTPTATSSRFTLDDDQSTFNRVSARISAHMENDRKREVGDLTAPEFRWTDEIDALRHRAVMRTRKRDARKTSVGIKDVVDGTPGKGALSSTMNHKRSSSTTSRSSPAPSNVSARSSRRKMSSPPVCWRLTQQEHVARIKRRQRRQNSQSSKASSEEGLPRQVRSTWTLQEIEDAQMELKEQGVDLSGPLLAMLSDLKTAEVARLSAAISKAGPVEGSTDSLSERSEDRKSDIGPSNSADSAEVDEKEQRPQCVNCGATSTPLWRRDANFELQCNACGLYEKLHKMPRPRALKKRRNDRRVTRQSPAPSGPSMMLDHGRSSGSNPRNDEWIGIHAGATCANCGTATTPLWRKDPDGRIICNACGLYYKLHNAHRPVTMRVDAIKRRSRCDDRRRASSQAVPLEGSATADMQAIHLPGLSELLPANAADGGAYMQHAPSSALGTPSSAVLDHDPHQATFFPPLTTHPQQEQQLVEFNVNANHAALMGHSIPRAGGDGGDEIHIPSALWENQVCPMGAWGENCCQNLPQPTIDVQSAILAAAGPSNDLADQAAVNAAMDAILNHSGGGAGGNVTTDWIANLTGAHDHHHHHHHHGGGSGTDGVPDLFDPGAIVAAASFTTSPTLATVVGPSYPLKRRKISRRPGNEPPPGTPQSQDAATTIDAHSPATVIGSARPASNIGTPMADWWSYATSPVDHKS